MEQQNLNSSETTKDILSNHLVSTSLPSSALPSQTSIATAITAIETSSISEGSDDCSINSIGYTADVSELQQANNYESPVKNTSTNQVTAPLTPTTNLKMLVAAASSALDRERRETEENRKPCINDTDTDPSSSRKMKSLALLCKRFLQVADDEIGPGKEFSLEMIATSLAINRRRIYDIINVMEALEMISKQSKNWYMWHGRGNLLQTLAKLKAMVADDPDIGPYLDNTESLKIKTSNDLVFNDNQAEQTKETENTTEEPDHHYNLIDYPYTARSVRFDKSLGVLCQKFVMLFLVAPDNEVTLEEAGRILVPEYQDDTIYMALNPPVNPKTKVRRLYDIANILTSLDLIEKKVFVGPLHIKKPGYSWSGPSIAEIEAVWNTRKQEYAKQQAIIKAKKSGPPCLATHLLDIKKEAPLLCSPVKVIGGTRFKRSLSFGGTSTSTPRSVKSCSTPPIPRHSTVLARPLCPKQVDYLKEMREFEDEMNKHAHRYPNVASVFHEFLQKYQSTLEQTAAANGRFILPKTASQQQSQTVQTGLDQPYEVLNVTETATSNASTEDTTQVVTVPPAQSYVQGNDVSVVLSSVDSLPPSNIVQSLANSILANILGTIQNTTVSEQIPQAMTVNCVSQESVNTPLADIGNIHLQENGTVLPIETAHREGFVHVDELLLRPGSRIKTGRSNFVFEAQKLRNSCPNRSNDLQQSCGYFGSDDFGVDKENISNATKCAGYCYDAERSPKRQRVV